MDKHSQHDGLEDEPLLKQGLVWKRGRKLTSTWKKRYFVLRPTTLSYHLGQDSEDHERRFIEITQNSTVTLRPDKHPFAFQVRTPGFRKITARCDNDEDLHLWMTAIEECIRRAPAYPIKCVIVGDDEEPTFGKRVMVNRYLDACKTKTSEGEAHLFSPHGYTQVNKARTRLIKTPDELGNVDILLEFEKGEWVKLMLWHLDGREQCTKLRLLAYPHSDIFIIVFSVSVATSFEKVDSYFKEIRDRFRSLDKNPLFLLVGTRLSSQLVEVGFKQAEEKARLLGASGYVECRIDNEEDCEEVFSDAVRLVIEKSLDAYATNDGVSHTRGASGILYSLSRVLKRRPTEDKPNSDSEDQTVEKSTSGKLLKSKPSERLINASMSPQLASKSSASKLDKASLTSGQKSPSRVSLMDGEEDSDEGSVIGVEVDDTDEEIKARLDRDFGLTGMKDDTAYTQKVLSRQTSNITRRSGDQSKKDLFDIHETPAEERERELEELRMKDAKKEREISRLKAIMDSLKSYNKAVEDQLRAMREELEAVNKHGGHIIGTPPPMPPLAPLSEAPSDSSASSPSLGPTKNSAGLPPLPSSPTSQDPERKKMSHFESFAARASNHTARSAFRANRATSVFFLNDE